MTQSIIVYRNPAEAAFWESGMAFPAMAGVVMAFICAVAFAKGYELVAVHVFKQSRWDLRHVDKAAVAGAIVGMLGMMWVLS